MQETNPSVVQPLAIASTVVRTGSTDSSSNERLHGSASTSTCRFLYIWSCPTQDRQSVTETVSAWTYTDQWSEYWSHCCNGTYMELCDGGRGNIDLSDIAVYAFGADSSLFATVIYRNRSWWIFCRQSTWFQREGRSGCCMQKTNKQTRDPWIPFVWIRWGPNWCCSFWKQ